MINQQTLEGRWNEIAGKLRSKWGQLNSDELQQFEGNTRQLVGYIQRKTGEARDKIEGFLDDLTSDGASTVSRAAESARGFTSQAIHAARDRAEHVADRMRDGYATAEKVVQERPAASVAAVFGAGLTMGFMVGLLMRSR